MTDQRWGRRQLAGFWLRVAATLVDVVVGLVAFAALVLLVPPVVDAVAPDAPGWVVGAVVAGVLALGALLYDVLMTAGVGGTLGKRAAGIEVRADDGARLESGPALGRSVGRVLSVAVVGLGLLWVAWDGRKQAWHDKLVGALVVKRRHLPPADRKSVV